MPGEDLLEKKIVVSCDGSALSNGVGAIGWGWVNQITGEQKNGGYYIGTNQIAELSALLEVLRTHREIKDLIIETDSMYAINSATVWLESWKNKAKPWTNANGKAVKNQPLIKAIDQEIQTRKTKGYGLQFRWVKGHEGNHFNEIADRLAVQASESWQNFGDGSSGEKIQGIGKLPDEALEILEQKDNLLF